MNIGYKIEVRTLEGVQLHEERFEGESDYEKQWEALVENDDSILSALPIGHLIVSRYEQFRGEWVQTDRRIIVND